MVQKSLCICALDESSLSIVRDNRLIAHARLTHSFGLLSADDTVGISLKEPVSLAGK